MISETSNLRICFIVPSLANMGPVLVARDIAEGIYGRVKQVKVFYFDEILDLNFSCATQRISFFGKLDLSEFDVIHTHGLRPDLFLKFHRFTNVRLVTTLHSNVYEELKSSHGWFFGGLVARIWCRFLVHDSVVVLSDYVKNFYLTKIINGSKKLRTIYNGRNLQYTNVDEITETEIESINELRSLGVEIIVGSVCVLNKRKGVYQLIEAVKNNSNLGLIIIGSGPEKKSLRNLASQLNIAHRVLFFGYKPNPLAYYDKFDVFGLVSYSEGFPLGLLEAIQLNTPSVVSNLAIYKEMFQDKYEINYYELENIQDLVLKINETFKSRASLVENANKRLRNNYTKSIMVSKYLDIYEGR